MRVTIIRDDGVVGVDGVFRYVDLSGLPAGVRAVQWDETAGHVEYDASPNAGLTSISEFQSFINLWTDAAPPAPTQSEIDAAWNDAVDAQLMAADLKIIRALTEGDTARVNAHKTAQAALRATRR